MGLEKLFKIAKKNIRRILITGMVSSLLFLLSCENKKITEPRKEQENNPPVIISSAITGVNENQDYNYQVTARDDDGDKLTYSLIEKPGWLSISNSTISGIAPEVLEDKDYSIKVKVSDGKNYAEQPYTLTVKNISNTHILTTEDLYQLSSVQNDSLIFSNPVNVSPQDILVAGISDITPVGFLREVVNLSSDKKTVNTKQASLEQTIENASFFYQRSLYPSDTSSFVSKRGVSESLTSQGFNFNITLDNVIIYDADGRLNTTADQITINGEFLFNLDFSLDFDISRRKISKVDFRNSIDEKADVTVNIGPFINMIQSEVKIANYIFNPVIAYIPPGIPVVIVPELALYTGVLGSMDPIGVRVIQEANLTSGLIYENNKWNPLGSFSNNFSFSFLGPQRTNFNYIAYVGPKLNLFLYGVIGPSGGANAYLEIDASENNWKLYGGLEALLGVKVRIFSKAIFDYSEKIIDFKKLLAEGGTEPGTGEKILFVSSRDRNSEIYMMDPDGSNQMNLTNHLSHDTYPAWSPDGNRIVFVSTRSGSGDEIYTMNSDGSDIRRLTNDFYYDSVPKWSPDGSRILYISLREGKYQIFTMNLDGTQQSKLETSLSDDILGASWSPDASKIVLYTYKDGNWEIYTMNSDGSGLKRLIDNSFSDIDPSWSPDGNQIVFASDRDGDYEIYIMDINGNNVKKITDDLVHNFHPSWSPDANQIVYTHDLTLDVTKNYDIYVINSNGTEKRNLTNHPSKNYYPRWFR